MKPQDLQTLAAAALIPARYNQTAAPTAAELLGAKVDRLGAISAAMAAMKREAEQIRAELEDAGLTDIDGQMYRVNFAKCTGRTLTNWEAIAAKFNPSRQLIAAHTTTAAASTRMTVKAHPTH